MVDMIPPNDAERLIRCCGWRTFNAASGRCYGTTYLAALTRYITCNCLSIISFALHLVLGQGPAIAGDPDLIALEVLGASERVRYKEDIRVAWKEDWVSRETLLSAVAAC